MSNYVEVTVKLPPPPEGEEYTGEMMFGRFITRPVWTPPKGVFAPGWLTYERAPQGSHVYLWWHNEPVMTENGWDAVDQLVSLSYRIWPETIASLPAKPPGRPCKWKVD